jgi:hypothetical protein
MIISVIIDERIHAGGGFQQAYSTANILNKHFSKEYQFIFFSTDLNSIQILNQSGVKTRYLNIRKIDRFFSELLNSHFLYRILKNTKFLSQHKLDRILEKYNTDLVYFTSPSLLALMTRKHNFILTVFDLCHRDCVEFPEIRENREFETRENFLKDTTSRAISIITDSETGRQNIIRRYNIDNHRVVPIPFLPSRQVVANTGNTINQVMDVKKKFGIDGDYIYYPAQLWPHKNHIYILHRYQIFF